MLNLLTSASLLCGLTVPPSRPAQMGRRAALAGCCSLAIPAVASALPNPFERDDLVGLAPPKAKKRMRPDGFGGFVERGEDEDITKPVPMRIADSFKGDEPAPAPAPAPAAAPAAAPPPPPPPPAAKAPSAPALSMDQMLDNSIRQKEAVVGRPLTEAEKDALQTKLRALLGA